MYLMYVFKNEIISAFSTSQPTERQIERTHERLGPLIKVQHRESTFKKVHTVFSCAYSANHR